MRMDLPTATAHTYLFGALVVAASVLAFLLWSCDESIEPPAGDYVRMYTADDIEDFQRLIIQSQWAGPILRCGLYLTVFELSVASRASVFTLLRLTESAALVPLGSGEHHEHCDHRSAQCANTWLHRIQASKDHEHLESRYASLLMLGLLQSRRAVGPILVRLRRKCVDWELPFAFWSLRQIGTPGVGALAAVFREHADGRTACDSGDPEYLFHRNCARALWAGGRGWVRDTEGALLAHAMVQAEGRRAIDPDNVFAYALARTAPELFLEKTLHPDGPVQLQYLALGVVERRLRCLTPVLEEWIVHVREIRASTADEHVLWAADAALEQHARFLERVAIKPQYRERAAKCP